MLIGLGCDALRAGQAEQAVIYLQTALRFDDPLGEVHELLALALSTQGDAAAALAILARLPATSDPQTRERRQFLHRRVQYQLRQSGRQAGHTEAER